jgi:hypothetical protein
MNGEVRCSFDHSEWGDGESPTIRSIEITPGETEEQSRTVRTSALKMLSAEYYFGTKVVPRLIIVLFLDDFLF